MPFRTRELSFATAARGDTSVMRITAGVSSPLRARARLAFPDFRSHDHDNARDRRYTRILPSFPEN